MYKIDKERHVFEQEGLSSHPLNVQDDWDETGDLREQMLAEEVEPKLRQELEGILDDIQNNAFLNRLATEKVSPNVWQEFAIQRYQAAHRFEALLEAGQKKAMEMRPADKDLAAAIEANLNDERGVVEGQVEKPQSHVQWRKDFYGELGLTYKQLEQTKSLDGTKEYQRALKNLIDNEDAVVIAGAILSLEASIPPEFKRMQLGRDKTFPNLSPAAKLYLDDHIEHDAHSHYPDLVAALRKYVSPDGQVDPRIIKGIEIIREAKQKFYQSIEEKLMTGAEHGQEK